MRIGITGAGGRIGSVLASHLVEEYTLRLFTFQTRDIAEESIRKVTAHPNCELVEELDLSNEENIKGKFKDLDVVIHLAGNPSTSASYEVLRESNFGSTVNVFDECIRSKVKRIIFASTNHTQHALVAKSAQNMQEHKSLEEPLKLTDVPYPDSLYGVSKLFGEHLGKLYAWRHGLECVCLRIGSFKNFEKGDAPPAVNSPSAEHVRALYLSHEDCVGYHKAAIHCTINSGTGIPFLVVYAASNNTHKIWDMTETFKALGFTPSDDSEKYFSKSGSESEKQ